jgi:hypothetical protein
MEKFDAQVAADLLCKQLGGKPWKPHVWENLGWHYAAYLGDNKEITVYPSQPQGFVCLAGYRGHCSGDCRWTLHSYANPNEAVLATLDEARKVIRLERDNFQKLEELFVAGISSHGL